ncbi:MAG: hypothetical protein JSS82_12465, partial [Bacteroidetes bacterium]|nr:hypothetical protein [Bacteroidota bacterium]
QVMAGANQFFGTSTTQTSTPRCSGPTCLLTKLVKLRITTSSNPFYLDLTQKNGLEVAFAYPAFHSNNYVKQVGTPQKCSPYTEESNVGALEYLAGEENKLFTEGANINNGICAATLSTLFNEKSYRVHTCDGISDNFQGGWSHTTIGWPVCGAYGPNNIASKNYGMVLNQDGSYLILPTNQQKCSLNVGSGNTPSLVKASCTGPMNTNSAKAFAPNYDPDKVDFNSCKKVYANINDASVCRAYAGNHAYQAPTIWRQENYPTPTSSLPYGVSLIREIMPGVSTPDFGPGPGYLWPVNPTNDPDNPDTYKSPVAAAGTPRHDFGKNYCSADDEDCCDGFVKVDYSIVDNPTDTDSGAVPVTICQSTDTDRSGIGVGCNMDRVGLYEVNAKNSYHMTADSMGVLAPMCYVMEASTTPQLAYTILLQLVDEDGVEITRELKHFGYESIQKPTDNINDDTTTSTSGAGETVDDSSTPDVGFLPLASILDVTLQSSIGAIALEIDPMYLIVCNTTNDKGLMYQADYDDLGNPTNPWPGVDRMRRGPVTSNLTSSSIDSNVCPLDNVQVPIPQCIPSKSPYPGAEYNQFSWYHTVTADKFNHYCKTCGCLGVDLRVMGDVNTQQYVCSQGRYACSPNYLSANDPTNQIPFTLNSRLRDQLTSSTCTSVKGITYTGKNSQERCMRDRLKKASPAVVSGYLRELSDTKNFAQFEALRSILGFLPRDWVNPQGNNKASLPNWFINGARYYNSDPSLLAPDLTYRMRVAVAGSAVIAEGFFTGGTFTSNDPAKPQQIQCVAQLMGQGTAQISIYNPYTQQGQYSIDVNCTRAVTQNGNVLTVLQPRTSTKVTIPLRHSGVATDVECQFRLYNPDHPSITLDSTDPYPCDIFIVDADNATVQGIANFVPCDTSLPNCGIQGLTPPPDEEQKSSFTSILWGVVVIFLIAFFVFLDGSAIGILFG